MENYDALRATSLVSNNKANGFFYSNTNLVWALDIPADVPHAYENVDITKAYLNFAVWATSAGKENPTWYTNAEGNRNKENIVSK